MNELLLLALALWCCWSLWATVTTYVGCTACCATGCTPWCGDPASITLTFGGGTGWATCLDGVSFTLTRAGSNTPPNDCYRYFVDFEQCTSSPWGCDFAGGTGWLGHLRIDYYPNGLPSSGFAANTLTIASEMVFPFVFPDVPSCGFSLRRCNFSPFGEFIPNATITLMAAATCSPISYASGSFTFTVRNVVGGVCVNDSSGTTQIALSP